MKPGSSGRWTRGRHLRQRGERESRGELDCRLPNRKRSCNEADARCEVCGLIVDFYHTHRIHSSLRYQSRATYEKPCRLKKSCGARAADWVAAPPTIVGGTTELDQISSTRESSEEIKNSCPPLRRVAAPSTRKERAVPKRSSLQSGLEPRHPMIAVLVQAAPAHAG